MPTASKLFAGLGLALTALISGYYFTILADDFRISNTFLGGSFVLSFIVGWVTLGKKPGRSNFDGMIAGLLSLITLVIVNALVFSLLFILSNLDQANMREPIDLILRVIQTSVGHITTALDMTVLVPLLVGGAVTGIATYQASIRWS